MVKLYCKALAEETTLYNSASGPPLVVGQSVLTSLTQRGVKNIRGYQPIVTEGLQK